MNSHRQDDGSKIPLHDEAIAREKWRGRETLLEGDENDGLPASETDNASSLTGAEDDDGRPGQGRPGDFPPPD